MIFDGSTYRAGGKGVLRSVYATHREQFSKDRDDSVISRLLVMREVFEANKEYPSNPELFSMLAQGIDISWKSIERIVGLNEQSDNLQPSNKKEFCKVVEIAVHEVKVSNKTDYHTCAWS